MSVKLIEQFFFGGYYLVLAGTNPLIQNNHIALVVASNTRTFIPITIFSFYLEIIFFVIYITDTIYLTCYYTFIKNKTGGTKI